MCRYGMYGPYKEKWACFECRKSFKKISRFSIEGKLAVGDDGIRLVPCPQCHGQMRDMGLDFKAPKQNDWEQWQKVELLFANVINFSSCGCGGPGPRPIRAKDVLPFLEARRDNLLEWQRLSQVAERAEELRVKRKKQRKRLEDKRINKIALFSKTR